MQKGCRWQAFCMAESQQWASEVGLREEDIADAIKAVRGKQEG